MSPIDSENCVTAGPQSALERKYLDEYLQSKGYRLEEIQELPKEEAKRLMTEACTYASFKLAELESRAKFRNKIHYT